MIEKAQVNPEVEQHLAGLDEARIEKNSESKSYSNFWSSYKGHVRGLLAGIVLGVLAGSGIGLALAAAGFVGSTGILLCAAAGLIFGAEESGSIGAASASCASQLAERHARFLDPENRGDPVKAADDKLMIDGRGHHFEFPPYRDKGKLFNWKSGAAGTIIGALSGVLIGASHLAAEVPAVMALGMATPVTAAVVLGVCGLTFGIERTLFKSVFNDISTLMGNRDSTVDQGREQARGKSPEQLLESRINRQEDIHHLQVDYDEKMFMSGVKGWFTGAMSGAVIGAMVGLAAGALALGVMAVVAPAAVFSAAGVISAFAAAGSVFGLKTFAEAGVQSATQSTSSALDDEFERGRALRQQGISLPREVAPQKPGFNPIVAVAMGAIGAAVGFAFAPALAGGAFAGLVGGHIAAATALIGGLSGAASGFGDGLVRSVVSASNTLYNNTYYGYMKENEPSFARPQEITPEKQRPLAYSQISAEEARNLDRRLEEGKQEGNFADSMIARKQYQNTISPSPFTG